MNSLDILYHGTTVAALEEVLTHGLRPRATSGATCREGDRTQESDPNCVYLTTCKAARYADFGWRRSNANPIVIEIDARSLCQQRFLPDEDYIKGHGGSPDFGDIEEMHRYFRTRMRKERASYQDSLDAYCTVAYEAEIPLSAINRVVEFDPDANDQHRAVAWAADHLDLNCELDAADRARGLELTKAMLGDPFDPRALYRQRGCTKTFFGWSCPSLLPTDGDADEGQNSCEQESLWPEGLTSLNVKQHHPK